jgi:O-acetylserine/cysteine efflux transporter
MRAFHIFLTLIVVAIWGFNFVVMKMSVDVLPPLLAAALRFTFAAFPLMLFVRPPKVPALAVVGFGLAFGFALYSLINLALFIGMPAGLASVVLQVQAFFTIGIAMVVLGDRPKIAQIIGAGVAFFGIGIIAFERLEGAALLPIGLTLLAALAWGTANVIAKRFSNAKPISLAVWGAACAAIPLYGMSFVFEGVAPLIAFVRAPDLWTIGMIGFLAYPATLFGLAVWNNMLQKYPASIVAPFSLLVPITGLLSGWLILGEQVTTFEIIGGGFVVAGLGVSILRARSKPPIVPAS